VTTLSHTIHNLTIVIHENLHQKYKKGMYSTYQKQNKISKVIMLIYL